MSLSLFLAAAVGSQPRIVDQVDPLDDIRSAFVFIEHRKTYLAVGCLNVVDRSSIAVLAKFDRFVDRNPTGIIAGGTLMQYRFDHQPPVTERWTSQNYVLKVRGSSAMRFMLGMKASRQIYVRAQRYDNDVNQLAFTYGDPSPLIEDVLGRCGYNPDGSRSASVRRN